MNRGHHTDGSGFSGECLPEPIEVANRAGGLVTHQIRTILEAAEAKAAEIELDARREADSTRREAFAAASDTLTRLGAIDELFGPLMSTLRAEADTLFAVHELGLRRLGFGASPSGSNGQHTLGAGEKTAAVRKASGSDGDGSEAEDVHVPLEPSDGGSVPRAVADSGGSEQPEDGPKPAQPEGATKEGGAFDAKAHEPARARVAGKSDSELAEAFHVAGEALAEAEAGDDTAAEYWRALRRAAIDEAASRPEFGSADPTKGGGRFRRRGRGRRLLRELEEARRQALAEETASER